MGKNLPIYEIVDGDLTFISLVESPAIESNFLCFSKDNAPMPMKFDDGERKVTGAAMIPDMDIYRYSPSMGEYYVRFSKDVIESIALKFFKQHRNSDVNVEHSMTVDGCTILESYFVNSERGIVPQEFNDLPNGTWVVTYKVENEELYEKIKSGEVKGFSVEGGFTLSDKPVNAEEVTVSEEDDLMALIESLLG